MTVLNVPVLEKICTNPTCSFEGKPQLLRNFYVRSGYKDNPTLPGHYNSECKTCLKNRSGNQNHHPIEESRVRSENLVIQRLKQEGIWAQTGKATDAPDVDVTAWGVVWLECKHSILKPRGYADEFTWVASPKQAERGYLADIVMLICEWKPETYTFHLFRAADPVFYMDGRLKTGFTYRPGRTRALKHGGNRVVMTSGMMEAARDNWGLIETVRCEHARQLTETPFPHRRWRDG